MRMTVLPARCVLLWGLLYCFDTVPDVDASHLFRHLPGSKFYSDWFPSDVETDYKKYDDYKDYGDPVIIVDNIFAVTAKPEHPQTDEITTFTVNVSKLEDLMTIEQIKPIQFSNKVSKAPELNKVVYFEPKVQRPDDMPLSNPDVPFVFEKIFFKAITNLIQSIMDLMIGGSGPSVSTMVAESSEVANELTPSMRNIENDISKWDINSRSVDTQSNNIDNPTSTRNLLKREIFKRDLPSSFTEKRINPNKLANSKSSQDTSTGDSMNSKSSQDTSTGDSINSKSSQDTSTNDSINSKSSQDAALTNDSINSKSSQDTSTGDSTNSKSSQDTSTNDSINSKSSQDISTGDSINSKSSQDTSTGDSINSQSTQESNTSDLTNSKSTQKINTNELINSKRPQETHPTTTNDVSRRTTISTVDSGIITISILNTPEPQLNGASADLNSNVDYKPTGSILPKQQEKYVVESTSHPLGNAKKHTISESEPKTVGTVSVSQVVTKLSPSVDQQMSSKSFSHLESSHTSTSTIQMKTMTSEDGVLNKNTLIMDGMDKQDSKDFELRMADDPNNTKLVQRSVAEDNDGGSSAVTMFTITGTFLVVVILVVGASAIANLVRNKYFQGHSEHQNTVHNRPSVA